MIDKKYSDKDLENAINKASEIQNSHNRSKTNLNQSEANLNQSEANLNQSELEEILSNVGFEPEIINSAISEINKDKKSTFWEDSIFEKHTPAQLAQLSDHEKSENALKKLLTFASIASILGSPLILWAEFEKDK